MAVHGQRGRDSLHRRRARGRRGARGRPTRAGSAVRAAAAMPDARVCVDLSPDFPDGHARGWRCRTLYDGPPRRACDRDPDAHTLAETLRRARTRASTAAAASTGWCVPERPAPACWRDADCAGGRCRFGSCLARRTVRALARAGGLAGAVALAAASLACRKHDAPSVECLRLDGPRQPVGFGGTFSIKATLDCPQLAGGRVGWRQVAGAPLAAMSVAGDGFAADRAHAVAGATHRCPVPWGVVPLSPRTRGRGRARRDAGATAAARALRREIRVAAAAPSRGPAEHAGRRARLSRRRGLARDDAPRRQRRGARTAGGVASLLPGRRRRLASRRRRRPHARAARPAATTRRRSTAGAPAAIPRSPTPSPASPMTTVLARGSLGPAGRRDAFGAAIPTARSPATRRASPASPTAASRTSLAELRRAARPRPRAGTTLPRDAAPAGRRRLPRLPRPGRDPRGVGALEHPARRRLRRLPRRARRAMATSSPGGQTAMARADQDPRARERRACARCHTTWGFLAAVAPPERDGRSIGARPTMSVPSGSRAAPATPSTIRRRPEGTPRLLRATPVPALLAGAPTQASASPATRPRPTTSGPAPRRRRSGSGAAVWIPATGAPLTGGAPHAAIAGGCVGCHRGGPDNVERGGGHAFRAPDVRLHAVPPAGAAGVADLRARAQAAVAVAADRAIRGTRRTRATRASIAARRAAARCGTCCSCWRIRRPARTTRATRGRCSTRRRRCSDGRRQHEENADDRPAGTALPRCSPRDADAPARGSPARRPHDDNRRPRQLPAAPDAPADAPRRCRPRRAIGVYPGDFYNQLVGGRVDLVFSPHVSFGGYLGYANLKGKDGRASNLLAYAQVEYLAGWLGNVCASRSASRPATCRATARSCGSRPASHSR